MQLTNAFPKALPVQSLPLDTGGPNRPPCLLGVDLGHLNVVQLGSGDSIILLPLSALGVIGLVSQVDNNRS